MSGLRRSKGGERGKLSGAGSNVRDCIVCGQPLVLRERKYHVRCNPRYRVADPCATCGHGKCKHRGGDGSCRHVEKRGTVCVCVWFVPVPAPATLYCPRCGKLHVNEREWATKPYHTQATKPEK